MRTSNSLLRNYRYIATIVLARITADGNFNDASLGRLHSASGLGVQLMPNLTIVESMLRKLHDSSRKIKLRFPANLHIFWH